MLCNTQFADRAENVGSNGYVLNPLYDDDNSASVKGGYSRLIEKLADGLDIRLRLIVTEIAAKGEDHVEVTIQGGETFACSHVVVSVPLGISKAKSITFSPPLSCQKQSAIDAMGYGALEKVLLVFDVAFWRDTADARQDVIFISDSIHGLDGNLGFPLFTDTSEATGSPSLVAYFQAWGLDYQDDSKHFQGAARVLKMLFPKEYAPPVSFHVTNWKSDCFAYGSYSYPSIDTQQNHYAYLAAPDGGGRILFCGEASSSKHAGYVSGAVETGIREATRLMGRKVHLNFS
jgi:monoamine oxidase